MPFQIPGAESATNAAIVTPAALGISYNSGRICGKMLSFASAATADVTVCCKYKLIAICTAPLYGRYLRALCLANSAALGSTKTKTQSS